MTDLQQIGLAHGTDKGNAWHSAFGRSFLDVYDETFRGFRHERFSLLELGVLHGNSLRMWAEYFDNASIFGVDIDPIAKNCETSRIKVIIADQADPQLPSLLGGPFRVIVDDASHVNDLTLATFDALWHLVAPGGFYVWEDMHASHVDVTEHVRSWPGMQYNRSNLAYDNASTRAKIDARLSRVAQEMDSRMGDIASVRLFPMMVLFEKAR
jgi:hypothetical protein